MPSPTHVHHAPTGALPGGSDSLFPGVASCAKSPEIGPALGTNAKSRARVDFEGEKSGLKSPLSSPDGPEVVDHDTGEILPLQVRSDRSVVMSSRRDRNARLLERFALSRVVRSLIPKDRPGKCHRLRQSTAQDVEIHRSIEHGFTFYKNLQTCGSVWGCPICQAKIAERRRQELLSCIEGWKAQGGVVLLLTLTHPHNAGDSLADLVAAEQGAIHAFFRNKAGRRFLDRMGCRFHVRAWEVTHGRLRTLNNGWHPHFHILLFVRIPDDQDAIHLDDFEDEAYRVWAQACKLGGLEEPSRKHGVSLENGDKAADYVAKMDGDEARQNGQVGAVPRWGADSELTRGHTKRAKDGETPTDLLRALFVNPKDSQAGNLWREFFHAFRGKRQLVYSRGMREYFELGRDLTDEEIAAKQEDHSVFLAGIPLEQWRQVLKYQAVGEALILSEHSVEALNRMLQSLEVAK